MSRVRNPQSGVSLLETLIALTVMAMIAIIIASSIGAIGRVMNRTIGVGAEVELALNRLKLRKFVEAAILVPFPDSDPELQIFVGRSDSLTFQAVLDDGLFWPGNPVKVVVSVANDSSIVVHAVGTSSDGVSEVILDSALTGPNGMISLQYFGRQEPDVPQRWRSDWDIGATIPEAIKINLQDAQRVDPPLVIRPAKSQRQSEMSLSSLLPPTLPSRP